MEVRILEMPMLAVRLVREAIFGETLDVVGISAAGKRFDGDFVTGEELRSRYRTK